MSARILRLGPPGHDRIEPHTQVDRIEITGKILARRFELEGSTAGLQPGSPIRLVLGEELAQGRTHHRQCHGAIDRLKAIEQLFDLQIHLFQLLPAPRERTWHLAPEEVQTHLDSIQRVAATVAEAAQHASKAFDLLRAVDDREHRRG